MNFRQKNDQEVRPSTNNEKDDGDEDDYMSNDFLNKM